MKISGSWLRDEHGRTVLLRGVNLGGSSKVPGFPDGATHLRDGFFNHRDVSFVGRPFPRAAAAEHFDRLRVWGFNCLRFLITWEAIEHAGPGEFDQEYLDYVTAVLSQAGEYGFQVIIDPHQDVWSRFSGGDGAPGWTLEVAGFNLVNLHETGAAFLHQMHVGELPHMIWPTNASKLATATMFTLFFAGNDFAPRTLVDGEPIQDYLQRHYLAAFGQVAARVRDMPHVIGYGAMNEPLAGYIGQKDLHAPFGVMQLGLAPTPFQGILLGAGIPQNVDVWELGMGRQRKVGTHLQNHSGKKSWLPDHDCLWHANGVWDFDENHEPVLLQPSYFSHVNGRPVDFNRDYYAPFLRRFASTIRAEQPGALLFVEPALNEDPPAWQEQDELSVYAPHWYDVFVLFLRSFNTAIALDPQARRAVFSPWLIRRSFARQLERKKLEAASILGGPPTFIGETGIAYDLRNSKGLSSGDFSVQTRALERTIRAMEENLLSYALWNYSADNDNAHGDQWNGENLSIFGRDQQTQPDDPYSGGRALAAVIRPYATALAGEPLHNSFDPATRRFELRFRHDPQAVAPTVIYVPHFHYGRGYEVKLSDGRVTRDEAAQTLVYHHDQTRPEHSLLITPLPPAD